jgi:hypothetical protein
MKSGQHIKDEMFRLMEQHYAETQDDNIEIWLPNEQWQKLFQTLNYLDELPKGFNTIYLNSRNVCNCEIVRYFGNLTGVRRKGEFAERSAKLAKMLVGIP